MWVVFPLLTSRVRCFGDPDETILFLKKQRGCLHKLALASTCIMVPHAAPNKQDINISMVYPTT
jgi:hypothetical protein